MLIVAWALCGAADRVRARERTPQWELAAGAVAASVAAGAGRLASRYTGGEHHLAAGVSIVATASMVAISVHLMLALPDGRLGSPGRRAFAGTAYAAAAVTGIALAVAGRQVPAWLGILVWSLGAAARAARGAASLRRRRRQGQGTAAVGGDRHRPCLRHRAFRHGA